MLLLTGDLIGGLLMVLDLNQLFDGQAGLRELLLDPGQRQGQGRALALQPPRQLGDKGTRHGRAGPRHVGDHQDQILWIGVGHRDHQVGPPVRQVMAGPTPGDPCRDAAQILNQRQPQHDRDGPQLAQLEGGDILVGGDEAAQGLRVHPAVAMGDDLQGQVIDPRQTGRWALAQTRQFPAVALGQMPLGGADLLFDQVEVIEQPFPGRADPSGCRHRLHEQGTDVDQGPLIGVQPHQQLVRCVARGQAVSRRPRPCRAVPSARH